MKYIKVTIKRDGSYTYDVNGMQGEGCKLDPLAKISAAMAKDGPEITNKAEFYEGGDGQTHSN